MFVFPDEVEKFWSLVDKTEDTSECWEWKSGKGKKDYPRIHLFIDGCRLAHRVSYFIHNGKIDADLKVLHKCDNVRCVNPHHLFQGTQYDNIQDMIEKGRKKTQKGGKNNNARLTLELVQSIREEHKAKIHTPHELAKKYNISYTHVYGILRNQYWPEGV